MHRSFLTFLLTHKERDGSEISRSGTGFWVQPSSSEMIKHPGATAAHFLVVKARKSREERGNENTLGHFST